MPKKKEKQVEEKEAPRMCRPVFRLGDICVGDRVIIYIKGFRGVVGIPGEVTRLSEFGIMLEDREKNRKYMIRYSEIKFIEVLQQ